MAPTLRDLPVAGHVTGVDRAGTFTALPWDGGPPPRIDGFTLGVLHMDGDAPHDGERHPDGDELLFVVSGRMLVALDEPVRDAVVKELGPGQGCVVPKGCWHRVRVLEPGTLIHLTPGPRGDHRPLPGG